MKKWLILLCLLTTLSLAACAGTGNGGTGGTQSPSPGPSTEDLPSGGETDETAQAPYFHYTDDAGVVHAVWFEDARSLEAKLRLIAEYGFLGAGIWNLMRPFAQIWRVLDSLYDLTEP